MQLIHLDEPTAALRRVMVFLVDITDGFTPEVGIVTPTIEISKDGAAQGAGAGSWVEIGSGQYYYEFTAGEVDTAGFLSLRVVKAGVSRDSNQSIHVLDGSRAAGEQFANGAVWANATDGVAGTGWPRGTIGNPVSNLADAKTIADANNLKIIMLHGAHSLNETMVNYELRGITIGNATSVNFNGNTFTGRIRNCLVLGELAGASILDLRDCEVAFITGSHAMTLTNCTTAFTIELPATGGDWTNIQSTTTLGTTLDFIGASGVAVYRIVGASGDFIVDRMANGDASLIMTLDGGKLTINNTCTLGTITVRGTGVLVDNSAGTTVNDERDPLLHSPDFTRDDALTFDSNNKLLTARRRVFPTAALANASTPGGTGEGETATFNITATHTDSAKWEGLLRVKQ